MSGETPAGVQITRVEPAHDCPYQEDCRVSRDRAWVEQERRNEKIDALFQRWGARLDQADASINAIKTEMLADRSYAKTIQKTLVESQANTSEYMASTAIVLQELASSIRESRDEAERNHLALLSAVTSNAMVAGNAVARADAAATRADHARNFVASAEGRVSTLTRAALAGWVLAIAASGTFATHIAMEYGVPWIMRLLRQP